MSVVSAAWHTWTACLLQLLEMVQSCLYKLQAFALASWVLLPISWLLMLKLEADECSLVADCELHQANSFFPKYCFLGCCLQMELFPLHFHCLFLHWNGQTKSRKLLVIFHCANGEKGASVGLPEVSIYTSVVISLKTLHSLAEKHPYCFRDGAFGLKWLLIHYQKTANPGQETKPRVCLKSDVL